jgi:hypothetical protein
MSTCSEITWTTAPKTRWKEDPNPKNIRTQRTFEPNRTHHTHHDQRADGDEDPQLADVDPDLGEGLAVDLHGVKGGEAEVIAAEAR